MTRPRGNRGWLWYFITLGVLTVVAIVVLVQFNLRQQLTPEKLVAARALWKSNGPSDYDMEYAETGSVSEVRKVRVRGGKVISALRDGQPLEERLYRYSDMPALFGFIETFLREDAEPGKPRTFCKAAFDPDDGHLVHYIRRVMGTAQRIEITVQMQPVGGEAPKPSQAETAEPKPATP